MIILFTQTLLNIALKTIFFILNFFMLNKSPIINLRILQSTADIFDNSLVVDLL